MLSFKEGTMKKTEIRKKKQALLRIKHSYHDYCVKLVTLPVTSRTNKEDIKAATEGSQSLVEILKKMQKDLDELLKTTPEDSEEYIKYFAMRAHVWNAEGQQYVIGGLRSQVKEEHLQLFMNNITLLEPYKMRPICIFPYLDAILLLCCYYGHTDRDSMRKVDDFIFKAEDALEEYEKNVKEEILLPEKLFEVPSYLRTKQFVLYHESRDMKTTRKLMAYYLFNSYYELNRRDKKLKYAVPSLQMIGDYNGDVEASYFAKFGMNLLLRAIDIILDDGRLKQADHLLAIAMYHCVRLQSKLPQNEIAQLTNVKGLLSFRYARWGLIVFNVSAKYLRGFPAETAPLINHTEFEEVTELMEPGVEIYLNQFPHCAITDPSEIIELLKRAKTWNGRALEQAKDTTWTAATLQQRGKIDRYMEELMDLGFF